MFRTLAVLAAFCCLALPVAAQTDWNEQARSLYAEAVSMRSVVDTPAVSTQLAERLAARFRAGGFAASDVRVEPVTGGTSVLVVRYRGAAESTLRPILAIAHMDVVDALPSDWSLPPFALTERDGYFYGRGSIDNKAGLVAVAIAFLRLKAEGFVPNRDLILAFTGDEETLGEGGKALAGRLRPLIDAEYALNADAGGGLVNAQGQLLSYSMQTSEKTYATFTLTTRNRGGHSSQPRPDNAIYALAGALTRIGAYSFTPQLNDTTRAAFLARAEESPPDLARALRRFVANPRDRRAADRIEQEQALIGSTRTTCVATRLAGGHGDNALPQSATATVNCRIFPGTSIEAVQAELVRVAALPDMEIALVPDFTPATDASPLRPDVTAAYEAAVRVRFPNARIVPEMGVGATDGAFLRAVGIPVYGVAGEWLMTPEDERQHGRDERLPVAAFYGNVAHWYGLLQSLAGGN